METAYCGKTLSGVSYNGANLSEVWYNGVQVFSLMDKIKLTVTPSISVSESVPGAYFANNVPLYYYTNEYGDCVLRRDGSGYGFRIDCGCIGTLTTCVGGVTLAACDTVRNTRCSSSDGALCFCGVSFCVRDVSVCHEASRLMAYYDVGGRSHEFFICVYSSGLHTEGTCRPTCCCAVSCLVTTDWSVAARTYVRNGCTKGYSCDNHDRNCRYFAHMYDVKLTVDVSNGLYVCPFEFCATPSIHWYTDPGYPVSGALSLSASYSPSCTVCFKESSE